MEALKSFYTQNKKPLLIFAAAFAVAVFGMAGYFVWLTQFKEAPQPEIDSDIQADIALRQQLIERYPNSYTDHMLLAQNYLESEQYQKAEQTYQKAHELQPEAAEPLLGLARLERRDHNAEAAVRYWRQAASIYSDQGQQQQVNIIQKYIELTQAGDFTTEPEQNDIQMPI